MPVNGQCQCANGFSRNTAGRCTLSCPGNQVSIGGLCATCAGGTIYDATLEACLCPEGTYKNNFGICEQTVVTPVTCDPGFYFENDNGCVACPNGCQECASANVCTKCPTYYKPSGASCIADCGDGYAIPSVEDCDDGNILSGDGCSSCKVDNGWTCSGIQPSFCQRVAMGPICGDGKIDANEECDDGNSMGTDGCSATCQE